MWKVRIPQREKSDGKFISQKNVLGGIRDLEVEEKHKFIWFKLYFCAVVLPQVQKQIGTLRILMGHRVGPSSSAPSISFSALFFLFFSDIVSKRCLVSSLRLYFMMLLSFIALY